jgi:cell division protein FtsB
LISEECLLDFQKIHFSGEDTVCVADSGDDDQSSPVADDQSEDGPATSEGQPSRKRWIRSRRGAAIAGLLLLAVVAFGCWLGFQVTHAKSNLEEARANAQQAKEALSKANVEDAKRLVNDARSHAEQAKDATHSLPWNIASVVPWLGSPFKTGQQISDVVAGLAADVLQPSVDVAVALSPDQLLAGNGHVDVQRLRDSAPKLSEISTAANALDARAAAISEPKYLSVMRDARSALQAQISDLSRLLDNTALAARLVPSMMGVDGPRSYFMAFQTNAEARGTGGLMGGFGILRFDNGAATVDRLGRNNELDKTVAPLDLGLDFLARYGTMNPTTDFRNANQSSHFPYAGQIWKSMWEQQSGTTVDGVIAIDPVALSYILGAVGSVTMADGETITKDNVVELTESTAYIRFADDNTARKAYLQDVASTVVQKMTGHLDSPRQLLDALGKAVSERRIAVWSASAPDQKLLEETPLAHLVPDDSAPYAAVVINNLAGNKADYYLTRQLEYTADGCESSTRKSTVTIRLTNTVTNEQSLPEYVAGQLGIKGQIHNIPWGSEVSSITLLATKGSALAGAFVNGKKVPVYRAVERGHPTFEIQLAVLPQKTVELKFELSEPTVPGAPRFPVQPLRDNPVPVLSVPQCPG